MPIQRQPTYRQPTRPRMQVPLNYNGHAIVDGEERPLGQLDGEDTADMPTPEVPTPRFDGLPRVSELARGNDPLRGGEGESLRRQAAWESPPIAERCAERGAEYNAEHSAEDRADEARHAESRLYETTAEEAAESAEPTGAAVPGGIAAPPRGKGLFDLSHFPFGHGIGAEELLLLGLILLLLRENADRENRGDLDETVILLGLLLLLG